LERLNKDYGVLKRREQPTRSFTKGFLQLLYVAHAQIPLASPYTMTDIDGTARSIQGESGTGGAVRRSHAGLRIGSAAGSSSVLCYFGSGTIADFSALGQTIPGEKVGIQVGTGVAAVTPTDTALATRILHGRATGRLEYGGCELVGIAFVNPNGEFVIRRYFTNLSGGSITVNEVGIYSVGGQDNYAWAFLIARDIVSPGLAVANNELLRVTYVPQITV